MKSGGGTGGKERDVTILSPSSGVGRGTNTAPTGDRGIKPRAVHASVSPHEARSVRDLI